MIAQFPERFDMAQSVLGRLPGAYERDGLIQIQWLAKAL